MSPPKRALTEIFQRDRVHVLSQDCVQSSCQRRVRLGRAFDMFNACLTTVWGLCPGQWLKTLNRPIYFSGWLMGPDLFCDSAILSPANELGCWFSVQGWCSVVSSPLLDSNESLDSNRFLHGLLEANAAEGVCFYALVACCDVQVAG